jgi:hypothetical protein
MRVASVELHEATKTNELSANVDGFRLFYQFPAEFVPATVGDVFLSAALLVAMRRGEALEIDAPCSHRLLDAASGPLQDVFTAWYPQLSRVEVRADRADPPPPKQGVASFFSGGVDGSYTFLRHRAEITHLVSVQGIDVQVDNDELWSQIVEANRALAEDLGVTMVVARTNIRRFAKPRGVGWSMLNGAGLASIAHVLSLPRCYVAATHTYGELFPWGSHPLSDGWWSGDAVEIVHDGPSSRAEKVKFIAREPRILERLRVCWHDRGYNCGVCEKCVRTRVALRLLGLSTPTLPPLEDVREVRQHKVWDESEESFFDDNLRLAERVGDREMSRVLRSAVRSYRVRRALAVLDENVLGGTLHRLKSRLLRARHLAQAPPRGRR